MQQIAKRKNRILALVVAGMLATTSSALLQTPAWAGGGNKGKSGKHEQKAQRDNRDDNRGRDNGRSYDQDRGDKHGKKHFNDKNRDAIHKYYTEQFRSGRCPPGLIKKHNGCVPPGQRRWEVGRQLPGDVIFYDLSPAIVVELGPPPAGHRFVRVASDILLIAAGTGMIVDALQDMNEY